MNSLNIDKQKEILKKIKTAQSEIRRKTLALLLHQTEVESNIEQSLKPVIDPLEKILSLKQRKKNTNLIPSDSTTIKTPESRRNLNKTVEPTASGKNASDSITIDTPAWDPFQSLRYENENENDSTPVLPTTINTEKWNEMFLNTIPEHYTKDEDEKNSKRRKSASNLDYYLNMLHMKDDKIDKASGVVYKNGHYELNRIPIEFDNHENYRAVKIGSKHFRLTPGINEMLFLKYPNEDLITSLDVRNYKKIAEQCAFTGSKKLQTIKLKKYVGGDGLFKVDSNKKREFVYWDNPNELVTRLELLHASKQAGHTGHDSEILSILEELREGEYIK